MPGVAVSVAVPTDTPFWETLTVDPASAVIVSVGVVSVVRWSNVEPELSANVVITGTDGTVVSTATKSASEAPLMLPAMSVWFTVSA